MPEGADQGPAARLAVVTGAASGIGAAIARALSDDGYTLALVDRDPIGGPGPDGPDRGHQGFQVDLSDLDAVAALAPAIRAALGSPSLLVNCAGWDEIQRFTATDAAFWRKVVDVNLLAVVATTHAFWDDLARPGGRLVNISSDAGRVGSAGETVYAAAKAGVIGFTKSVARELAPSGATANCVCPGPVETPFLMKNPPRLREALVKAIPLRRFGTPDEVSGAVRFFAAPGSSYVTGQVVSVSGGLTMVG